ncbi:histidine kinase dimerization/phosphoacceptor domain-containing protein [Streptomyces sp. NPDC056704]|uniref:histidine kinase dimerization/phosphoacceptor domain-containing protein n=1 Tax=Streptomyces sp. NPDC056704 TaxID=3345917 RepID=UPI0036C1BAB0
MIHVQASSTLHRLQKNPAMAQEALTAIKQSSKDGLQELRATLGDCGRSTKKLRPGPHQGCPESTN